MSHGGKPDMMPRLSSSAEPPPIAGSVPTLRTMASSAPTLSANQAPHKPLAHVVGESPSHHAMGWGNPDRVTGPFTVAHWQLGTAVFTLIRDSDGRLWSPSLLVSRSMGRNRSSFRTICARAGVRTSRPMDMKELKVWCMQAGFIPLRTRKVGFFTPDQISTLVEHHARLKGRTRQRSRSKRNGCNNVLQEMHVMKSRFHSLVVQAVGTCEGDEPLREGCIPIARDGSGFVPPDREVKKARTLNVRRHSSTEQVASKETHHSAVGVGCASAAVLRGAAPSSDSSMGPDTCATNGTPEAPTPQPKTSTHAALQFHGAVPIMTFPPNETFFSVDAVVSGQWFEVSLWDDQLQMEFAPRHQEPYVCVHRHQVTHKYMMNVCAKHIRRLWVCASHEVSSVMNVVSLHNNWRNSVQLVVCFEVALKHLKWTQGLSGSLSSVFAHGTPCVSATEVHADLQLQGCESTVWGVLFRLEHAQALAHALQQLGFPIAANQAMATAQLLQGSDVYPSTPTTVTLASAGTTS